MKYYMAFDGGGTKLQGLIFDSGYHLIASTRSGGVNRNVHKQAQVDAHIRECVDLLFELSPVPIPRIECIYTSWSADFTSAVRHHCPCGDVIHVGEGVLGTLSCGITGGICALSGTGSDVFYVDNIREIDAIGGWGYLLGDDGSGVWIGRQAIRSMMRYLEKIGPKSYFHTLVEEQYHPDSPSAMSATIYSAPSPPYFLGTFCKMVNDAAQSGDAQSQEILTQAGEILAESVREMAEKHGLSGNIPVCTTGSVFQHCTHMCEAFRDRVRKHLPECTLHSALFEPVVGCVIYCMIVEGHSLNQQALDFLLQEYEIFRTHEEEEL